MILRQSQKQIVAIKTSSIKIKNELENVFSNNLFQFQLVRLKWVLRRTPCKTVRFQFQLVRLKSNATDTSVMIILVSIPTGSIKIM